MHTNFDRIFNIRQREEDNCDIVMLANEDTISELVQIKQDLEDSDDQEPMKNQLSASKNSDIQKASASKSDT